MAKFTPGALVGQISGSVGGTTFSHNRFGPYMRRRAVPITSTTPAAMAAKAALAAGSTAWQALAAANKLSWNAWALVNPVTNSLGQAQALTGHQAFTGIYARCLKVGTATLTLPPTEPAPTPLTSLTQSCDIGPGNFGVAFTATPLGGTHNLWIRACVVDSLGINFVENLLRYVMISGAAQASPFDHEAAVEAVFGELAVGMIVHVSVAVFSQTSKLMSPPLRDTTVVIDTT